MCSISVDPIPSTMSVPNRSDQPPAVCAGSGSAADDTDAHRDSAARRVDPPAAPEQGRHAEQHGRPVGTQRLKDRLELGRSGHQHRGRPEPQREGEPVAQPIGVEQLRRRERDVAGADAEHAARVVLARVLDVVLQMHDALGLAGRARAIEPEGHVVAMGLAHRGVSDWALIASSNSSTSVPSPPRTRYSVWTGRSTGPVGRAAEHRSRPGRAQSSTKCLKFSSLSPWADRHRDNTDPHRGQEHDREYRGVVQHQQHALFAPDAELPEQVAGAVGPMASCVAHVASAADHRP